MWIYIPTYGRANNQRTYYNIPLVLQQKTTLVVQKRDYRPEYNRFNTIVLPEEIQDIASTRDWIVNHSLGPLVMLDDDLDFATRRIDQPEKFKPAMSANIIGMFSRIETLLDAYAHVGVRAREGANRVSDKNYLYETRMMRILAYNPEVLKYHQIKFAPYTFMCDFGVTLELLTRGYRNVILNSIVHNQPGSNTQGGCSLQRTTEKQREAAEFLAKRFPQFVDVIQKQTKTSWKGESRYDVRIQWKKAYDFGKQNRSVEVLDRGKGECTAEEGGYSH